MIEQIITIVFGLVLALGGCWHSSCKRHSRTKAQNLRARANIPGEHRHHKIDPLPPESRGYRAAYGRNPQPAQRNNNRW